MKVLVTGASGFIGSALCDALLARGDEVVGLTRDPRAGARHQPERHLARLGADPGTAAGRGLRGRRRRRQPGRREDQPALDRRGQAADHGEPPHRHPQPGRAIAALERKPRVLVSQSAVGYYGDRGEAIVDESAGPGEGFDAEVVREWEKAAHEVEAAGVRLVDRPHRPRARPARRPAGQLLTPFKLGVGGPLAGGGQYMSWIHVDDEVGILLWALDDEKVSGVVNATAPNPVTNREFSKALGRALGRPAVLPVPGLRARPDVRQRVRRGAARRAAGDAAAGAGPRLRVPAPGARRGAARPALGGSEGLPAERYGLVVSRRGFPHRLEVSQGARDGLADARRSTASRLEQRAIAALPGACGDPGRCRRLRGSGWVKRAAPGIGGFRGRRPWSSPRWRGGRWRRASRGRARRPLASARAGRRRARGVRRRAALCSHSSCFAPRRAAH